MTFTVGEAFILVDVLPMLIILMAIIIHETIKELKGKNKDDEESSGSSIEGRSRWIDRMKH